MEGVQAGGFREKSPARAPRKKNSLAKVNLVDQIRRTSPRLMTRLLDPAGTAEKTTAVAGRLSSTDSQIERPCRPEARGFRRPDPIETRPLPRQSEHWMAEIAFIANWLGLFFCGTVYSDEPPADMNSKTVLARRHAAEDQSPLEQTSG